MSNSFAISKRWLMFALVALSTTGFSHIVHAQGSPLNLLGFGQPVEAWTAHLEGMGGGGTALTDRRTVNGPNPASWSWLERSRLETQLHAEFTTSTEPSFVDSKSHDVRFGGFTFGTQFGSNAHVGLALGFNPLTDAASMLSEGDSAISHQYRSEGGISEGFIGLAARVHPGIAIGAKYGVLFGNVRHVSEVTFADPNLNTSNFERDYAISGMRGTFGVIVVGDSLTSGLRGLTLGLNYSMASNLTLTQRTIVTPISSVLDTTVEASGVGKYPSNLQAGLGIRLSSRYNLIGDLQLQDFSTAYLYSPQASSGDPTLAASTRYSVGIERLPNMANEFGITSFWDALGLRFGASYYQMPFRPNSTNVRALALSAGLGIPISFESVLDLSFTAGQRTPQDLNLAPKDLFFRIGATISLSERWFVPTRTDE